MKKLFTLLFMLLAGIGTLFAWDYEHLQIGDLYYNLDASTNNAELSTHYGVSGELIIPDNVSYNDISYTVTSIASYAFSSCWAITSVSIPNSVISIGAYAFSIENLSTINLPNSVTYVGTGAFMNCKGLSSPLYNEHVFAFMPKSYSGAYTIPNGIESIAGRAFQSCKTLSAITLPNSLESIGDNAFNGCSGLTEMILPNSVTSIGNGAFSYCENLISVSLTENIISIGERSFMDCTSLGSIVIPNNLTTINSGAFYECTNLLTATIGSGVTSLEMEAFAGCVGLTSIICEAETPPSLGIDVFNNVNKTIPLHVPAESVEAYRVADGWSDFGNIQAISTTIDISANQDPKNAGDYYSTFYHSSQRYTLPGNGTEAYVADLSGGDLILTRIAQGSQVLPNNVAVILKAPTSTITLTETNAAGVSFSAENDLRGVDVVTPLEDLGLTRSTCYVLSGNSTDGVGFYQCNSDNLKAHKAYLPYAGGPAGAPRHIRFVFDETEDVGQVQGENVQDTKVLRKGQLIIIRNGVEYNVAGQIVK